MNSWNDLFVIDPRPEFLEGGNTGPPRGSPSGSGSANAQLCFGGAIALAAPSQIDR
jgi:hypothetical protein